MINSKPPIKELVLTRVFDAPRSLVFKVWTEAKHVQVWWGPAGCTSPRCDWDAQPGNRLHIDMTMGDGTVFPMGGQFLEVMPPARLVLTAEAHMDDSGEPQFEVHTAVTFADLGNKTEVTIKATVARMKTDGPAAQALGGMEMGWTQSLDRLAAEIARAQGEQA
jgi:uncharacterized protein YndB with AHSA1/START domain